MSASNRVTRPPLERMQPIRSWSTLFTASPAGADAGAQRTEGSPRMDNPSLNDVVARSVELGYRVVDEYIRQGQKAALRLNERSYGAQAMTGDVQDLGMRMLEYASDFAGVWLEFVQVAATASAPPVPAENGPAQPPATPNSDGVEKPIQPGRASEEGRSRVRIEVRSTQTTEVSLDIRPGAVRSTLIVHALRAMDPDTPRLSQVTFQRESDDEPGHLRIEVPADQPPGIYNGLIIDEKTSLPVGSVSVRIGGE